MTCRFCGTNNDPEEHRCIQCGRRTDGFTVLPVQGAAALDYSPVPGESRRPAPTVDAPLIQPTLPLRPAASGRVVSIADFRAVPTPATPQSSHQTRRTSRTEGPAGYSVGPQRKLDFDGVVGHAAPEAMLSRKAPVAAPMRRLIAGLVDFAIVGAVVAAIAVILKGDPLVGSGVQFYVGLAAFLGASYKLGFVAADADSVGIRVCGLELVNFDGYAPTKRDRLFRAVWAVLSLFPAGLGLIWAFVDAKEHLTWHDQSTNTYLSPVR